MKKTVNFSLSKSIYIQIDQQSPHNCELLNSVMAVNANESRDSHSDTLKDWWASYSAFTLKSFFPVHTSLLIADHVILIISIESNEQKMP